MSEQAFAELALAKRSEDGMLPDTMGAVARFPRNPPQALRRVVNPADGDELRYPSSSSNCEPAHRSRLRSLRRLRLVSTGGTRDSSLVAAVR